MAEEELGRLQKALAPFANFYRVAREMGGPSSPGDISIHSHIAGHAALHLSDFEGAHNALFNQPAEASGQ